MSIVMTVLIQRTRMPDPQAWAVAIREAGFDLDLDTDFSPTRLSGFLPCRYGGQRTGFEYFFEPIDPDEDDEDIRLPDRVLERLDGRDASVSFVTRSEMRGLMASTIASAVLCSLTDGVLWDTEADEFIPAADALAWGRRNEVSLLAEL